MVPISLPDHFVQLLWRQFLTYVVCKRALNGVEIKAELTDTGHDLT